MVRERNNVFNNIDWTLVIIYLILVLMGWLNIYAAVYNEDHKSIFDLSQSYGKQMLWISTSLFIGLVILLTDARFFSTFAYLIYGITILSLIAVLLVGSEVSGSKSWFEIGGFRLQPAEFAKFATNLAIARFFSGQHINVRDFKTRVIPLILLGIPGLLILLQNDTGSALVYSSFILVLYRMGMSGNLLLAGALVVLVALSTLMVGHIYVSGLLVILAGLLFAFMKRNRRNIINLMALLALGIGFTFSVEYVVENFLEEHQKTRINVLLGKELDLKGAGYNVNQSKIAIGSGGFLGKGYLNGTQTKYNFVPEQSTDFIFCTVGEEWGFVGSLVIIVLFLYFLIRIINLAERQRSDFSRIYGYGVAAILFFHFMINIGMTIGLVPVIGIPLPFFSYGGSSLWAFTILLFIFIKQDANRNALL
ncbi:rod shape-determining protein RodA [Lentimicrobium sp.]|uniref:rod shape-determining protein RodA n=1 Tax=Lentimicrobium sp. TaxID=2034841 RepID=UPI0025E0935E|nr:rod shape-determining protein RodA [Lentimicrobium sp.]MCO5256180.1 rod shape-determining protein RodA [Lentimicrobium sp.]MCO5262032.1 rod shape-determining protein RodA [Lentimicrobium sp.]HPJ61318.1 rod shape-determining protein RodA [Lentimicrobium sp.]HPR25450.1 rod shape-determining protein RodA [Lentimicrobium sp.]